MSEPYDVVVPAFKVERTIGATLDSLLGQSHPPARIIVADDASPDRAADVADGYDGVEVVRYPENRGLNGVQNAALELVSADVFAFVDSDDVWHRDAGRHLVDALERHDAAGATTGRVEFPYEDEVELPGDEDEVEFRELTYDELLHFNWLNKSSTMYRTEAVRGVGGIKEDARTAGDHDLGLRVMEAGGTIVITPWRGLGLRMSAGSYSRGNPAGALRDQLGIALPRLSRDDAQARRHARTLWLRALARTASDGHDLRAVPTLGELGVEAPAGQRALETVVRSPLRHALASGWRVRSRTG